MITVSKLAKAVADGRMAFDAPFIPWGDTKRRVIRFTCAGCGVTNDAPISTSEFPPIEFALKRPRRAGWQVHETRRADVLCPDCQPSKRRQHAPTLASIATEPVSQPEQPAQATTQEHNAPMSTKPDQAAPKPDQAATPRDPTHDERLRIRRILDECFDDKAGQWLDGLDDKKAGEKIGVPWALVTRIREAAYGPIRVDPELAAIRKDMAEIDSAIVTLCTHLEALKKRQADLAKRIEARGT